MEEVSEVYKYGVLPGGKFFFDKRELTKIHVLVEKGKERLRRVYLAHIEPHMSFTDFLETCAKAWEERHGYCIIEKKIGKDGSYEYIRLQFLS